MTNTVPLLSTKYETTSAYCGPLGELLKRLEQTLDEDENVSHSSLHLLKLPIFAV
jgi:hypothetical protein